MKKLKILFVAFSHQLTPSQAEGWDNIIMLSEVNLQLQKQMSAIPADATLEEIQTIAEAIVVEAQKNGATHFYCTGEPTLTLWTNLYASQAYSNEIEAENQASVIVGAKRGFSWKTRLICVQSTTKRESLETIQPDGSIVKISVFNHVQWRDMF
jgi:hypothetical protein